MVLGSDRLSIAEEGLGGGCGFAGSGVLPVHSAAVFAVSAVRPPAVFWQGCVLACFGPSWSRVASAMPLKFGALY